MSTKKKVKPISEKLNQHQLTAIGDAVQGNFLPLIECCLACDKAIAKAFKAEELGVPGWGAPTAHYYVELRTYLEQFLATVAARQLYRQAREAGGYDNGK